MATNTGTQTKTSQNQSAIGYQEESTMFKFPFDLSEVRYMQFNFFDGVSGEDITNKISNITAKAISKSENTKEGYKAFVKKAKDTYKEYGLKEGGFMEFLDKTQEKIDDPTKQEDLELPDDVTSRSALDNATFVNAIFMPLVNNLRESINQGYNAENGALASMMGELESNSKISAVSNSLSNAGKLFGARVWQKNPDFIQQYTGSALRSFVLSWQLTPNSKDEAKVLFEIIRIFKRMSSPIKAGGGVFIKPPLFCNIHINNEHLQDSIRMDEMVISQINVNYSETGYMETFKDGVPKAIMLEMTVNERRMKTEEDWSTEYDSSNRFSQNY